MPPLRILKYHALGNDYLVAPDGLLPAAALVRLCDRHFGVGADGVLVPVRAVAGVDSADFAVRIFNPDGSEAEKSGSGLRIFARYLWDSGAVGAAPVAIATAGGVVRAQVLDGGRRVQVALGRVSFAAADVPLAGVDGEWIDAPLDVGGMTLRVAALTVGNPHCVVLDQPVDAATAQRLGPLIENHPLFPRRTNVQFLQPIDRHTIGIEIWERGAGYTLASGTSSCAAAAVARRLGWVAGEVTVVMPGGTAAVTVADDGGVTLSGGVTRVLEGVVSAEIFA